MKALRGSLIVVGLGGIVICVAVYAFSSVRAYDLSVNVRYGEAVRACEEDGRICSFSTLESAERYLSSPEHQASVAMRELKQQQDAAASKAASASIEKDKRGKKQSSSAHKLN